MPYIKKIRMHTLGLDERLNEKFWSGAADVGLDIWLSSSVLRLKSAHKQ